MSLSQDSLADALSGRFRLEDEIGSGGWAVVYLAEDLKHRRRVAIKVLRPELASAVGAERFTREIEVVAALRHPHILPLHDSGEADGFLYFVMPFIEGDSLRRRFEREGPLPLEDALAIAREVADALEYAHHHGVVHRDIKPENILLDSGHAVVTDFGIARVTHAVDADRLTGTGVSIGTPLYMSPEQVTGDAEVDYRTDIYSLGCVLYEALAGDAPYTGATRRAIFARKLVDPVPRLRVVRERVPEALESAIDRALAREPADRFRSAGAFGEALRAVPSEPAPVPVGPAASGRAPARRGWRAALAAAAGLPLLLLAAGALATRAFDFRLQMPTPFMPSRTDALTVGFRALVPSAIYALVAFAVFLVVQFVLAQLLGVVPRIPGVGRWTGTRVTRLSRWWKRTTRRARPRTLADLFFLGSLAASLVVLWIFRDIVYAMVGYGEEVLACAARPFHRAFQIAMGVVIAGLAFGWWSVFRWLGRSPESGPRMRLVRAASLAWIVALALVAASPWRLLWDASAERLTVGGERAYLLRETPTEYVVYEPRRHAARIVAKEGDEAIERLGIPGYLFEEPAVFRSGVQECHSITGEPAGPPSGPPGPDGEEDG